MIFTEIVVLVIVLQSSFVQYLFADAQRTVSDWLVALSEIPDQAELAKLSEQITPNFEAMRPYQKNYLHEVLESKSQVNHFYDLYCVRGDKNPYISGASLRYFCSSIQQTTLLHNPVTRSG